MKILVSIIINLLVTKGSVIFSSAKQFQEASDIDINNNSPFANALIFSLTNKAEIKKGFVSKVLYYDI